MQPSCRRRFLTWRVSRGNRLIFGVRPMTQTGLTMRGVTKRMLFITVAATVLFYVMVLSLKSLGVMPEHITWVKACIGPGIAGLFLFSSCVAPLLLQDFRSPQPRQNTAGSEHFYKGGVTRTGVPASITNVAQPNPWAFAVTSVILIGGLVLIPVIRQIGVPLTLMNSLISSGPFTWAFICTRNRGYLRLMLLSLPFGLLAVGVFLWMLVDPHGFALLMQYLREHALIE